MSEILAPAPDVPAKTANTAEPVPVVAEPAKVETPPAPSKYDGKTTEQVIEMHRNAESRLGEIQNELGTMRGIVTDLTQLQSQPATPQPVEQETIDVSGDDLIQNPVETIRRVVATDAAAKKVVDDADQLDRTVAGEQLALQTEFGDINAIVATPEFSAFASRTPTRLADLNAAAKGEGLVQVRAARRLLEDYNDFNAALKPAVPVTPALTPVEQARAVSTEGAGPAGPISNAEVIYEADVLKMIQDEPMKYRSPSFQSELTAAIKEGRYVKSG